MHHQTLIGRSLQAALRCSLLFLLGLVGSFAYAQTPAPEPALTRTAHDAQLQWGPCPAIFPTGCQIAVLRGDPSKPNADGSACTSPPAASVWPMAA